MEVTRDHTALLVSDMQNGFTEDDGSMAAIGMPHTELRAAIPGCLELLSLARSAQVPVIYTRYVFRPDQADAGVMATEIIPAITKTGALTEGSWDAEIIDELRPAPGEIVIDKSRPSSFYGTRLEPVLHSIGIRSLVLAGITTNICVETTARDAGQRDYLVHVTSDATAEFEQERHDYALNTIGFFFGWVTSLNDIRAAWSQ